MLDSPVDEIKSKIDLVDLISEYIQLKKIGTNYKALCPFHNEKTPSFIVSQEKQIWHCFGCFPPGALIKTETGLKEIEKIRAGERVMTHKAKYCKVIRALYRPYYGEMVSVTLRKLSEQVNLTSDHKVYAIKTKNCKQKSRKSRICQYRCKQKCPTKYFNNYKIEKIRSDQIKRGDYLLYPIEGRIKDLEYIDLSKHITRKNYKFGPSIKKIPLKIKLDNYFLKLLGYWVAEGSNHRAYIRFSLGRHEEGFALEIQSLIKRIFNLETDIHKRFGKKSGIEVSCCHSLLANIFENLLGKGAANKHFPHQFVYLPAAKQKMLINAIHKGDGYVTKKQKKSRAGRKHITTISPLLALQLRDFLLRLHITPSVNIKKEKIDKNKVRHKKSWDINWHDDCWAHYSDFLNYNKVLYWILPVKKIKKKRYKGVVYNLTVEKDHSYVADSFMVGNCGEGGDIFGFIMKMEGLEFPEALRLLAGKAGVVLKQQDPGLATKKNRLLDICKLSAKFYHKVLRESEVGKKAKEYLINERGLTEETIDDWQIGFAPDSWDNLLNLLKKKGFSEEEIFLAGLAVKKDRGVGYYDRFRNRIMFPISEVHGNIIGFTGRVMPGASAKDLLASSGQEAAKYVNTPQTLLYDKGRVLFALDRAKQEIKKYDLVVVVEGQMDVIASHKAGIKNVVASSGTSLTESQINLIKRYTKNVAMAFDMDVAGQAAALRGIELALNSGLNVKVIELPKNQSGQPLYKDPDECVKKNPELWQKAINTAKPFMEYLFDLTFTKYNIQKIEEKKRAVYQILLYMNMLPDKIEQGHYLKELAEIIHEPEEILREMMSKKQIKARTPEKMLTEAVFKTNQREEAISDRLLALCLWEPNFFNYVIENLPTEMVPKPEAKSIYKQLIIYYTNRQADSLDQPVEFDYNEIKANLNHQEVKYLDGLLLLSEDAFLEEEFNFLEEELKNLTREAKKIAIVKALTEVQAKIQQAEKGQNLGALEDLSAEFNDLLEHLNELQHY